MGGWVDRWMNERTDIYFCSIQKTFFKFKIGSLYKTTKGSWSDASNKLTLCIPLKFWIKLILSI